MILCMLWGAMMVNQKFHLFGEVILKNKGIMVKNSIKNFFSSEKTDKYFVNKNKEDCIRYILDKYSIIIPEIYYEKMSKERKTVHGIDHYIFKIPFVGNKEYFKLRPVNECLEIIQEVFIENCALCFEIIDYGLTDQKLVNKHKSIIHLMKKQAMYIDREIEDYNYNLKIFVEGGYDRKLEKIADRKNKLNKLNLAGKLNQN